jgi:hypothetical protein
MDGTEGGTLSARHDDSATEPLFPRIEKTVEELRGMTTRINRHHPKVKADSNTHSI